MNLTEKIYWHPVGDQLPDDDTTVLIIIGGEVESFMGFLDADQWRLADGMPVDGVLYWAELPGGPVADHHCGMDAKEVAA